MKPGEIGSFDIKTITWKGDKYVEVMALIRACLESGHLEVAKALTTIRDKQDD